MTFGKMCLNLNSSEHALVFTVLDVTRRNKKTQCVAMEVQSCDSQSKRFEKESDENRNGLQSKQQPKRLLQQSSWNPQHNKELLGFVALKANKKRRTLAKLSLHLQSADAALFGQTGLWIAATTAGDTSQKH